MRRKIIDSKIEELNSKNYSSLVNMLIDYNIEIIKRDITELGDVISLSIKNKMVLSDGLDPLQEKFIMLHEFAHILFHDRLVNCFTPTMYQSKEEKEANYFAVKMIMLRENANLEEISYLGVPIEELIKLREVGML